MSNFFTISKARATLPTLVENASKDRKRYFITVNGQPKAILMGFDEAESLMETVGILSSPKTMKSIKKGLKDIKKGKLTELHNLLSQLK